MNRIAYVILLGVITAGIVHLAILLRLPHFSGEDAWARLSEAVPLFQPLHLENPLARPRSGNEGTTEEHARLPSSNNPFIEETACRFTLTDGVLHIRGEGHVPFWSLSIFDDRGINIYSVTDRAAMDATLDIAILTPDQRQMLKEFTPEPIATAINIETNTLQGFVLLRSFRPDSSWEAIDNAFHRSITCQSVDLATIPDEALEGSASGS